MNAKNLYESTMQKENRTLLRYTLESAVKEIEMVRYIESNREELLKNVNVTKQDLLNQKIYYGQLYNNIILSIMIGGKLNVRKSYRRKYI